MYVLYIYIYICAYVKARPTTLKYMYVYATLYTREHINLRKFYSHTKTRRENSTGRSICILLLFPFPHSPPFIPWAISYDTEGPPNISPELCHCTKNSVFKEKEKPFHSVLRIWEIIQQQKEIFEVLVYNF